MLLLWHNASNHHHIVKKPMKSQNQSKAIFVLAAIVGFVVFGMSGLIVQGQDSSADQAPTLEECKDAWRQSMAKYSCGHPQVNNVLAQISVNEGECKITVGCSTGTYGVERTNNWQGSAEDMQQLNNCDGDLHVGEC